MSLLRPLAWAVTGAGVALIMISLALVVHHRQVNLFAVGFFLAGAVTIFTGLTSRSQGRGGRSRR